VKGYDLEYGIPCVKGYDLGYDSVYETVYAFR